MALPGLCQPHTLGGAGAIEWTVGAGHEPGSYEPPDLVGMRKELRPGESHRSWWQSLGRPLGLLQSCAPSTMMSGQDTPALTV